MSTTNTVDLSFTVPISKRLVFYEPNLVCFEYLVKVYWYHHLLNTSVRDSPWRSYVTFPDFLEYIKCALITYAHLTHNATYREGNVFTDSESKIKATWHEKFLVPRYMRDTFREICRPMFANEVTFIPLFRLVYAGSSPLPRLGVKPSKFSAISMHIQQQYSECDPVPIEKEAPLAAPLMFVASRDWILSSTIKPELWRFEAFKVLRHFRRSSNLFDEWRPTPGDPLIQMTDERASFPLRQTVEPEAPVYHIDVNDPRASPVQGFLSLNRGAIIQRQDAERFLGYRNRPAGWVPPDLMIDRRVLDYAYSLTELQLDIASRITTGEQYDLRSLPPLYPVLEESHYSFTRMIPVSRFPTDDTHSKTPPTSPRAGEKPVDAKDKGKKRKTQNKSKPKAKDDAKKDEKKVETIAAVTEVTK